MTLWLTDDDGANALLTEDPLALLIGMLLDQQIPMEKAFRGPYDLRARLQGGTGALDARAIAEAADLPALFATTPAIHRFPGSMATRVQDLCRAIVDEYDGDCTRIWADAPTGAALLKRMEALPGFGKQKAQIFVALLGKQRQVRPKGWREAAGGYGEDKVFRSVADVTSKTTLLKVREYKQAAKAKAKAAAKA